MAYPSCAGIDEGQIREFRECGNARVRKTSAFKLQFA
jgi:hypothetical protein